MRQANRVAEYGREVVQVSPGLRKLVCPMLEGYLVGMKAENRQAWSTKFSTYTGLPAAPAHTTTPEQIEVSRAKCICEAHGTACGTQWHFSLVRQHFAGTSVNFLSDTLISQSLSIRPIREKQFQCGKNNHVMDQIIQTKEVAHGGASTDRFQTATAGICEILRRWADIDTSQQSAKYPRCRPVGRPGSLGTRTFTGLYRITALPPCTAATSNFPRHGVELKIDFLCS